MKLLKLLARSTVFPIVHFLRLDTLIGSMATQQHLVLCFHGVTNNPNFKINNRHMPVHEFDRLIRYIARNYTVVSVDELFNQLENGTPKNKKKRICLTFDDGYLNNLTTALPILEKYQVPATFYIISEGIDNPDFLVWTDLLDLILVNLTDNHLILNNYRFEKIQGTFICEALEGIDLITYLKSTGPEKYSWLHVLAAEMPQIESFKQANPDYWKLLDRALLKQFDQSPYVSIGSHTKTHHNLANVDAALVDLELQLSKQELEAVLEHSIDSIAYPDGSYNESVKDAAERIGYTHQFAVTYKTADDRTDHRILPRLGISNSTTHQSTILRMNRSFKQLGF